MNQVFKNIKTGIYNFAFFRKVVWNFRWWDYIFNLGLFSKSLEYSAIETEKKGHLESSELQAKQMREVIEYIKKVRSDEFVHEAEKIVGYELIGFDFEEIPGTDNFRLAHKPGHNEEKSREVIELSRKLEKENWELIWKKLNDEMQGWWD